MLWQCLCRAPVCTKPSPGDRRCSHSGRDICITRSMQTELVEEEAHAHVFILCLPRSLVCLLLTLSLALHFFPSHTHHILSHPVSFNLFLCLVPCLWCLIRFLHWRADPSVSALSIAECWRQNKRRCGVGWGRETQKRSSKRKSNRLHRFGEIGKKKKKPHNTFRQFCWTYHHRTLLHQKNKVLGSFSHAHKNNLTVQIKNTKKNSKSGYSTYKLFYEWQWLIKLEKYWEAFIYIYI